MYQLIETVSPSTLAAAPILGLRLVDTILEWSQAAYVLIALAGVIGLLAKKQFGALFVYIFVAAVVGVFVFNSSVFRAVSEKVCDETANDLTIGDFNCAPGGGDPGAPAQPVIEVDD